MNTRSVSTVSVAVLFALTTTASAGLFTLGGHSRLSFGELPGKDRAPGILCIIGELLHVKMKGSAPGCLTGVHRGYEYSARDIQ
jgi:hypothetical protein